MKNAPLLVIAPSLLIGFSVHASLAQNSETVDKLRSCYVEQYVRIAKDKMPRLQGFDDTDVERFLRTNDDLKETFNLIDQLALTYTIVNDEKRQDLAALYPMLDSSIEGLGTALLACNLVVLGG